MICAAVSGVPLLALCTPANVRDDVPFLSMLDTLPPVKGPGGRGASRYKPWAVVGDAGYGHDHIVRQVVERRILPLLAPRGKAGHPPPEHGSGLGRVRYVVERTIAWMSNFRRIDQQCYERTGSAWPAFNDLACCVICANKLRQANQMKMAA